MTPQYKHELKGYGGCMLWLVAILGIISLLISCSQVKRAIKTLDDNRQDAAEYCADRFPVRDSIIKGDTVTTVDTSYEMLFITDTVTTKDTVRITITKPVTVTKTKIITDTVIRENRAAIEACEGREDALNGRLAVLTSENESLEAFKRSMMGKIHIPWWWLVVAAGVGYAGFRFRKILKL